ncbi:heterokaryon incompatibility protein-domain-containing protein [Halenospora varia]|nr:heterokaryon incompatibility protein-domain-containing protein [Halenospora varia]
MAASSLNIISTGLYDICREISTRKKPAESYNAESFPHHKKIHDLIKASDSGCKLCNFLWSKLSAEEKLSLGVGLTPQLLSGSPQISYKLEDGQWAALGCTFNFLTLTDGNIEKELAFLRLEEYLSPNDNMYSQITKAGNKNNSRYVSGITIASSPADMNYVALGPNIGTGSTASLEQAKRWITKCVEAHAFCNLPRSKLPTRLVWISPSEDGALRLCDIDGLPQDTHYMALSHCWGTEQFLTLKTNNLGKPRQSIPFGELTRVFQDAIHVARFMGIDYIWIDSLCIIQDSPEDWARESLPIKDVYSNSYCNIAAIHASNGEKGCFADRSTNISPLTVNIPPPHEPSANYFSPGRHRCRDTNLWTEEVTNSILLQRAWVFQERLLARESYISLTARYSSNARNLAPVNSTRGHGTT